MELYNGRGPLLAPSICFICEQRPDPKTPVVDTLRVFEPNGPTQLTGRKYVCGSCIETMGSLIGLASDEKVRAVQAQLDATQAKLRLMKKSLKKNLPELAELLK